MVPGSIFNLHWALASITGVMCARPQFSLTVAKSGGEIAFCGLDSVMVDAEASLGDARVAFLAHCQEVYSVDECDSAVSELWRGQDLTASVTLKHDISFCQTLRLVVAASKKPALIEQSQEYKSLEKAVSGKIWERLFWWRKQSDESEISGQSTCTKKTCEDFGREALEEAGYVYKSYKVGRWQKNKPAGCSFRKDKVFWNKKKKPTNINPAFEQVFCTPSPPAPIIIGMPAPTPVIVGPMPSPPTPIIVGMPEPPAPIVIGMPAPSPQIMGPMLGV